MLLLSLFYREGSKGLEEVSEMPRIPGVELGLESQCLSCLLLSTSEQVWCSHINLQIVHRFAQGQSRTLFPTRSYHITVSKSGAQKLSRLINLWFLNLSCVVGNTNDAQKSKQYHHIWDTGDSSSKCLKGQGCHLEEKVPGGGIMFKFSEPKPNAVPGSLGPLLT